MTIPVTTPVIALKIIVVFLAILVKPLSKVEAVLKIFCAHVVTPHSQVRSILEVHQAVKKG